MENKERLENAMAQSVKQGVQTGAKKSVFDRVKQQGNFLGMTQTDVSTYLGAMGDRIAKVLPKHLTPERIIQMAATTIQKNPQIAKCSPSSLLGAVMQASILGFPPVDALNYCYFVPYGNDVQFQCGYLGMIELARRSGKVKMVYAEVVREGDDFVCEMGLFPKMEHKPSYDNSKPMTHVYAVVHYTDGGYNFVVLSKSDVERLRMMSPMQKGSPKGAWASSYESMAKAKAIKQLAKYMPLNIDERASFESDEAIITPDNFTSNGEFKVEDAIYEPVAETEDGKQVNTETGELFTNEEK